MPGFGKIQSEFKAEAKSNPLFAEIKSYGLPIIIIIVVSILVLFIIKPRVADIFKVRKEVEADKIKLASLQNKSSDLKSVNYSSLLSDISLAQKAVPSDKNIPMLIIGVERLAAESGVKIESIQLAPGDVSKNPTQTSMSQIDFKLSVSGAYENVKGFFEKSLVALRLYKISDFNLITNPAGITVNMNASAFSVADPKIGPDIAEPLPKLSVPERNTFDKIKAFTDYSSLTVSTSSASRANPFGGL
ncbi:MAG TPA: type 4a pilus biogenesis protein PilO [Patescibacteria group bacterium]